MSFERFYVHNGQAWALAQVPVLDEVSFRREILESCAAAGRLVSLFAHGPKDKNICIYAVVGMDHEGRLSVFSMQVPAGKTGFESLTPVLPQAHLFEREIAEQSGLQPQGHPWPKPVRRHQNYSFYQIHSEEVHEVAVGPVHAGIIEPGHFRFQCHGEEVLNLEIQLGYQHRGIEKMMEEISLERAVLVAESVAGDTVIGHTSAFCSNIEALSDTQVPLQAEMIRAMALELERLANHVGDLGALSTDIGFLPVSAYYGRLRGEFLNLSMELCGSRFGRSLCRPGGVLFSLDEGMIDDFRRRLLKAKKDFTDVAELFFSTPSVLSRLESTGRISRQAVEQLGLVGLTARACGHERDVRTDYASGMFRFHHIPVSTASSGDVYARALVRRLEAQRSIEFLLEALQQIPSGELLNKPSRLKPDSMALSMAEGWRGEIAHVAITDSQSRICRYKIKDPSFNNWMALSLAVRGGQISDFPLCNKSFNLSYAGHDL
ncbi:MAG: NADH-quinone oxidoreductase subunit C [Candidatus Omnitrophica bacterium]|nr:NADH-quinone oxidoreductase subunit C [Candidatus Omnitrophota bacterium]MDE2008608.1 NADH-quinone oxidoreductase subunit C [Candidatus Omnitrophota bacterium]